MRDKIKQKAYSAQYRKDHLEYFANAAREYRKKYPERVHASQRKSYQKNKEIILLKQKPSAKLYRQKNKKIIQAKDSIRHLEKKQRVPIWADHQEIKRVYVECPDNYEVDHIVPLHGKDVSGLHVEYNLQYLTKEENMRKSNHYPHPEFH